MTESVAPLAYNDDSRRRKDDSMYTAHAQARLQQRAIPDEAVDTLLSYGERRRHHGADIYYLSKAARSRVAGALGKERYNRLHRSLDTYLVVSDDGRLITAAHRCRRLKF